MHAIVIANGADADGGVVIERFEELGWSFELWRREEASQWPNLPDGLGLIVALGSDWSVYWQDISPMVTAEANLLRTAHGLGIPIFGICFGGQILAHALGGGVERAAEPEIGWFSVISGPEMDEIPGLGPWFQWHYDRFTPPPGATECATGPQGSQAFMLGRSFGVQFHPEVTAAIVTRWATGAGEVELSRLGIDGDDLIAQTRSQEHVSRSAGRRLVDWFVERISPLAGVG